MSNLKFYDARETAKGANLAAWFCGAWWIMLVGSLINSEFSVWWVVRGVASWLFCYMTILCILEYKHWKRMILVDELLSEHTIKA